MTNYIERYWRDATPEDAIKEPPMVARFRNSEEHVWVIGPLMGIRRDNFYQWYSTNLGSHKQCQVYDAPDPGEGWRLLDTANEKWQEGDEIYNQSTDTWRKRLTPFQDWALSLNRRRIIPTVIYVPFTWEDVPTIWGREILIENGDYKHKKTIDDCIGFDSGILHICGNDSAWLVEHAVFLDTRKPVGKEVRQ